MSKLPSFQFYPGDWLKDPALRLCSPQARALWIDMLCLMWETESRGILRTNGIVWTEKDVEKTTGIDRKFLQELVQKGVCAKASRSGVFYSKRMVRDELKRSRLARNGQKGGKSGKQNPSKTQAKPEANPEQNPKQNGGSSSSSSFSSSLSVLTDTPSTVSESVVETFIIPDDVDRTKLSIPTTDGKLYRVPLAVMEEMQKLYPRVDVVTEILAMHGWASARKDRHKDMNEMRQFITGWLKRKSDELDRAVALGSSAPRRASDVYARGSELVSQRGAA